HESCSHMWSDCGVTRVKGHHRAAVVREVAREDAVADRVLGAGSYGRDTAGHDQHGVRTGHATHQRPERDAEIAKTEQLTAREERRYESVGPLADAAEDRADGREDTHGRVGHPEVGHDGG